jgi:hypothetical protein
MMKSSSRKTFAEGKTVVYIGYIKEKLETRGKTPLRLIRSDFVNINSLLNVGIPLNGYSAIGMNMIDAIRSFSLRIQFVWFICEYQNFIIWLIIM